MTTMHFHDNDVPTQSVFVMNIFPCSSSSIHSIDLSSNINQMSYFYHGCHQTASFKTLKNGVNLAITWSFLITEHSPETIPIS